MSDAELNSTLLGFLIILSPILVSIVVSILFKFWKPGSPWDLPRGKSLVVFQTPDGEVQLRPARCGGCRVLLSWEPPGLLQRMLCEADVGDQASYEPVEAVMALTRAFQAPAGRFRTSSELTSRSEGSRHTPP